jgi:serine/threonine protein kinase
MNSTNFAKKFGRTDKYIGAGGYGCVFSSTNKNYAIKEQKSDTDIRSFVKEASFMNLLSHKNLLPLCGVSDECEMAMPLGVSNLSDMINGGIVREMSPKRRLRILLGLFEGLAHMHHNGILHNDIKLDNILIMKDGSVKICDFGLATQNAIYDEKSQPNPNNICTWCVRSPEQNFATLAKNKLLFRNNVNATYMQNDWSFEKIWLTEKADVFSLGLVGLSILLGTDEWLHVTREIWLGEKIFDLLSFQRILFLDDNEGKDMEYPFNEDVFWEKYPQLVDSYVDFIRLKEDKYASIIFKALTFNPENRVTAKDMVSIITQTLMQKSHTFDSFGTLTSRDEKMNSSNESSTDSSLMENELSFDNVRLLMDGYQDYEYYLHEQWNSPIFDVRELRKSSVTWIELCSCIRALFGLRSRCISFDVLVHGIWIFHNAYSDINCPMTSFNILNYAYASVMLADYILDVKNTPHKPWYGTIYRYITERGVQKYIIDVWKSIGETACVHPEFIQIMYQYKMLSVKEATKKYRNVIRAFINPDIVFKIPMSVYLKDILYNDIEIEYHREYIQKS